MTGLLLVVATLATTSPEKLPTYAEAYRQHKEDGRPLVVLVGAQWCPACQAMKSTYIPDALRSGALKGVAFTMVDVDAKRNLANRLMRGSSVPQLVMYYDSEDGPKRLQLNGVQDVDSIRDFVSTGVQQSHEVAHQNELREPELALPVTSASAGGS